MIKCPFTLKGNHLWKDEEVVDEKNKNWETTHRSFWSGGDYYTYITVISYYPKCSLCKIVNVLKKPLTRKEKRIDWEDDD